MTATLAGLCSRESTSPCTSGGIVAEKKRVCFWAGSQPRMRRTSWMKPMSSIRSASSSTKISSRDRSMSFWP
ncbi:Uncharacterised protein [Flavonifractor plautii]|uniref:Uncharacterized protein n=1 Tax=Flavonifractor plautii TaxID=292800 RepID=A0A174R7N2_FLAPL|nr:Uncharacterised protein [Flavonifractor plautii]